MRLYVVVRDFSDGPGMDLSAIGWSRERALEKAQDADAKAPTWAKENPIIRVAAFELKKVSR